MTRRNPKSVRRGALFLVFLLALVCRSALAHWVEHKDLPDWAKPGRVRWCVLYGTLRPEFLDLVAEARQNLLQGNYLAGSPHAARAQGLGIRGMTYIPLTWDYAGGKIFEQHPELRGAEAIRSDGSRFFVYHAGRFTGCYNQPGFRQRRLAELDRVSGSPAIFFDTTALIPCHCYMCRRLFRDFCVRNYGKELPMPEADKFGRKTLEERAYYLFGIETVTEYFKVIREHLNQNAPPPLICPNLHWGLPWHIELIARGVPDLVFFEETGHPPFRQKFMGYKIGQAASHGKVVGQLIYLPPEICSERGRLTTSRANAGLEEPSFEAPLLPQEIMLAIAEAQACNGVYITAYLIDPAAPMVDRSDAMASACLGALKRYYGFVAKYERLFVGAQPGADVALLYPIRSQLWNPTTLSEDMAEVGRRLMQAGQPFEVIVEDDLEPAFLKKFKVLVVAGAACLSPAQCNLIRSYVEDGGRAIVSQAVGLYNENGDLTDAPMIPRLNTLSKVEEFALGKGRILFSPEPLSRMPAAKAVGLMRGFCRGARYRVENPSPSLLVNVLEHPALGLTEIHLVNYDFRYTPLNLVAASDDGSQEERIPFVSANTRVRKVLPVSDPSQFRKPVIQFCGVSASDKGYELVVSFNGKDVARVGAAVLKNAGWHEVPVERSAVRKGNNEVILRVEGKPNPAADYFNLGIDRDTRAGRSSRSEDGGKTYSSDDLSGLDPGVQRGEYMIRLAEARDRRQSWPAQALLESVKVRPVNDVTLSLATRAGTTLHCALLSPDHGPMPLEATQVGDRINITVPRIEIYEVLLISTNRKTIEGFLGRTTF